MKTRLILKAGQAGTKRLVEIYGDALLSVRFRYDTQRRQRLKAVEFVVEKTDWTPPVPKYSSDTRVFLRISASDMPARNRAKEAGGRWIPERRLWVLKYGRIAVTPLEKYIYVDDQS